MFWAKLTIFSFDFRYPQNPNHYIIMKKAMKIMAMVLFVASMTVLTSCTKSNEKLILGKWELQSMSYQSGGQTIEMTMAQIAVLLGEDMVDLVVEFKSNGYVYASADGFFDEQGSRYSVDRDILTVYEEDGNFVADIVELTDKKLSIGKADDEDADVYMVLTFVRV